MSDRATPSLVTESVIPIWPPPLAGSIVLLCLMTVGITGNLIIILTYLRSAKLRTPSNMFYVNLAIADLGYNIILGQFSGNMVVYHGDMGFGDITCFVQALGLCLTVPSSFYSIGSIALCRYIIIVNPSKKKYMTWGVCLVVCALCWILPILLMVPAFTGWSRFAWQPRQYHCSYDWGYSMGHNAILFVFGVGVVSVIMCFCYIKIYMVYRNSKKRVTAGMQNTSKGFKKEEFRLALQLFVVYAIYNACWMPYFGVTFSDRKGVYPIWLYMLIITTCSCNSSVNFFIYLHYNKLFRMECMRGFSINNNSDNSSST